MSLKDIDKLIHGGYPLRRLRTPIYDRVTKAKPVSQPNPSRTLMKDVVPTLTREDFLNSWKEDRAELVKVKEENEKIVKERDKLKKAMQTTYSRDWPSQVSAILNEGKDEKEKK